jgi:rsbT antagonist protein RsbS
VARVPVIRIGDTLIATVQDDLRDTDVARLQEELGATIERSEVTGVLLDLSVVETIDSFLGRAINDIAVVSRLLGAETVVVGVRPAVAITLVELGLELRGVRTALSAESGIAMLKRAGAGGTGDARDGR